MSKQVEVTLWSSVRKPLTYLVSDDPDERDLLGRRVTVPVGSRRQLGVITALESGFAGKLRSITGFADLEPVLSESDLTICRFMSEYYYASLGECLKTFLPAALTARLRQRVRLAYRPQLEKLASAGDETAAALLTRFADRDLLPLRSVADLRPRQLASLCRAGAISYQWDLKQSRIIAGGRLVSLCSAGGDVKRLGSRGKEVIALLEDEQPLELDILRQRLGATRATIDRLQQRGLITISDAPLFWDVEPPAAEPGFELTPEQRLAVTQLEQSLVTGAFAPHLLHGVTGSGKTEVYLRAIQRAISLGRQALVIVPEIGLSQALFQQLRQALGPEVGLIHSRLTDRARLDIWQKARQGLLKVVLGPRSAVFSPLPELGLIVVDEEHDQSLKQESPAPRYHARDVALFRARRENCTVVLGSATPAVESYHNAVTGKYRLLEIPQRVDQRPLPRVRTVDLKTVFARQGYGYLTDELIQAMESSLGQGGQVMLLLNRRGFSPSVHCFSCGEKFVCRNCAVTMVYHKGEGNLLCHTCGYRQPYPEKCPNCGSNLFLFRGVGTEKLQEELAARFPGRKVLRMDIDSTRKRGAFSDIYEQFRSGRAEILVGTQMIAKGFDFPRVALVGIISADTSLELPDFRARERTFQLLTQAAGRAGRLDFPGEVILQTMYPDDPTIDLAARQDYLEFYEHEIADRQELGFPPFARLILVTVEGRDAAQVDRSSRQIVDWLQSVERKPFRLLGPIPAPVLRQRSYYRYHLMLKTEKVRMTLGYLDQILSHSSCARRSNFRILVDVDAIDML